MRILITAAIFSNTISMGSRRPRAIAELLAQRGHDVTVIAAATPPELAVAPPPGVRVLSPIAFDNDVFKTGADLPLWKRLAVAVAVSPTYPAALLNSPRAASLLKRDESEVEARLKDLNRRRHRTALRVKSLLEEAKWTRQSVQALEPVFKDEEPFDIIFSTYGPVGSLWLGEALLDRKHGRNWVVDLRDPIASPESLLPVQLFLKGQLHHFMRKANAVTVISEGLLDSLLAHPKLRRFRNKCSVVTNGFLRRSLDETAPGPTPDKPAKLRIAYTGMLYHGRRDPGPLFDAIRRVTTKHPEAEIEVVYAGKDSELIRTMAAEYGLSDAVETHGVVPHQEAVRLQSEADLLLALTWNDPDYRGVLPGKFLEYLGVDKPIIALVAGVEPDAELARITNATNVGIAVEATEGEEGVQRLAAFLEEAALSKQQTGIVPFTPNVAEVSRYDYESIVNRLEAIFDSLATGHEK